MNFKKSIKQQIKKGEHTRKWIALDMEFWKIFNKDLLKDSLSELRTKQGEIANALKVKNISQKFKDKKEAEAGEILTKIQAYRELIKKLDELRENNKEILAYNDFLRKKLRNL